MANAIEHRLTKPYHLWRRPKRESKLGPSEAVGDAKTLDEHV
jgi:hypothetical protein